MCTCVLNMYVVTFHDYILMFKYMIQCIFSVLLWDTMHDINRIERIHTISSKLKLRNLRTTDANQLSQAFVRLSFESIRLVQQLKRFACHFHIWLPENLDSLQHRVESQMICIHLRSFNGSFSRMCSSFEAPIGMYMRVDQGTQLD